MLVDADAVKAAIEKLIAEHQDRLMVEDDWIGQQIIRDKQRGMRLALAAIDALPDAGEGRKQLRAWTMKQMRFAANEGDAKAYVNFTLVLEQIDGKEYIAKDDTP